MCGAGFGAVFEGKQRGKIKVIILTAACFIASGQAQAIKCPDGFVIMKNGLSQANKIGVFHAHNKIRRRIANGLVPKQPKGINLKKMVYDDILGEKASAVSSTCAKGHVTINDLRWNTVGQNLYSTPTSSCDSTQDWKGAVNSWFMENEHFIYPNKSDADTLDYTQLVWADTNYVGCDFVCFKNTKNNTYTKLYTCNYGPGGNIAGEAPYITGTSGCENLFCPNTYGFAWMLICLSNYLVLMLNSS